LAKKVADNFSSAIAILLHGRACVASAVAKILLGLDLLPASGFILQFGGGKIISYFYCGQFFPAEFLCKI
jgi:hypothetical protein